MTNMMTVSKSLNKDEKAALRERIEQFVKPILEQEGICPCCVAHVLIAVALNIGDDFNMVPTVADMLLSATDVIGDDALTPTHTSN